MQIQSIQIERFGRKTNLTLDGISDQLSVIYGPNGAGKSTTIQFLRWMLYGNYDEVTSRFVGGSFREIGGYPAAGSIAVTDGGRRRSIARHDDGSRYGRVSIDGGENYARQSHHMASLLGDVSATDFDLVFAPDFQRDDALSQLLQGSLARGIDLTSQHLPSERVQELRLRIDNYRRDMDRLSWRSGDLTALLDQKRAIERRIDELAEVMQRRRAEYDQEYEELTRRIQDGEIDVERLRGEWHTKDQDVMARRRELEEAWANAEEAKREYVRRRRNELAEMDAHITRVRSMQSDVQRRHDRLQAQLRENELELDRSRGRDESACLVQSIAKQLDEMQGQHLPESDYVNRYRSAYRYRGTQAPSGASLELVRSEVGRLCDTLQREKTDDRVRAMAEELDQLQQCETMLQRWLSGLISQRDQVANETDEAERHGVSLVVDEPSLRREYDRLRDLEIYEPLRTGRLTAVQHSCDGYEPINPETDALLIQLTRHRDVAHNELQSAERQLNQWMQRRHDLERALSRMTEREIEAARRELAETESYIRAAEERERLQRSIAEVEAEIARLRDTVRNSPVTEHAARILQRLTRGQYRDLRIDSTRNVSIQDHTGSMVPLEHLSRGIRDQVYLSFCLAIITEYRRRGVQLPFIVNDAFVNIDSENDDTLAGVLREFAAMGQQVLVFTRHQHVSQLLRNLGATSLELTASPIPTAVRADSIDHVRFRPRTDVIPRDPAPTRGRPSEPPSSQPVPPPAPPLYDDYREFDELPTRPDQPTEYQRYEDRPPSNPTNYLSTSTSYELPATERAPTAHASDPPLATAPAVAERTLSISTPIESTGTVDPDLAARLMSLGIISVGDFMEAAPAVVENQLVQWGLHSRPIRRWQDQLALRTIVPGIGAEDARVLVASGINSAASLASASVDELTERVAKLLRTYRDRSGARMSNVANYHRDRIANWIHSAQVAYEQARGRSYQTHEHTDRGDYERRPDDRIPRTSEQRSGAVRGEMPPPYHTNDDRPNYTDRPALPTSRWESSSYDEIELRDVDNESDENGSSRRRSGRSSSSGSSSRSSSSGSRGRSARSSGRSRSSSRPSRSSRSRSPSSSGERELRFYLDKSAPVVEAPTIGARMAERLHSAGIRTVAQLLKANPDRIAAQLDHKKVNADTVIEWQQQANLACRIPQLRGHDAQILVACGIFDPPALATMTPDALWAIVRPFIKTPDCKRIIRNGKAPDKAEIQDWITWAQNARSLQTA